MRLESERSSRLLVSGLKIYRYENVDLKIDCWQKSVIWSCNLPTFNEDISYILTELGRERKYWFFGFTREQYIRACRRVKHQAKFCTDKRIVMWNPDIKLNTFYIDEKYVFDFGDQVLFDRRKAKKSYFFKR